MCILSSFQSLLLIVEKFLMKCGFSFSYVLIGKDFLWFKLPNGTKGIQKEVTFGPQLLLVLSLEAVFDTCFSSK